MSRYIPADVRRELRQEANFGCAICGVPIIEYHHIIPYSDEEHHDPNHMIALCPTHHRPSDDSAITKRELYDLKEDPHNKDIVDYMFYYDTSLPELELGRSCVLFSEPGEATLFEVNGQDLLTIRYENQRLSFDVQFHSKSDDLIAEIDDNDWWADTNEVWDLQYKSPIFKVYNEDEELGLKVEHDLDTGLVTLIGKLQYGGDSVNISRSRIYIPSANAADSGVIHLLGGEDANSIKGEAGKLRHDFTKENDFHPIIYEVTDGECWL